jgi:DHA1 family bicyclomycin/chloramphenicol resistance-like MFS transporter
MVVALVAATLAGAVFIALSVTRTGGVLGFVLPAWTVLAMLGFVIPTAPAIALSRHPEAAGTAAALLGAAQFGVGALIAPVVGLLGNDEIALSLVMTAGVAIALLALVVVGAPDDHA